MCVSPNSSPRSGIAEYAEFAGRAIDPQWEEKFAAIQANSAKWDAEHFEDGQVKLPVGTVVEYKSQWDRNGWRDNAVIMSNDGQSYMVKGLPRADNDGETSVKVTPDQVRSNSPVGSQGFFGGVMGALGFSGTNSPRYQYLPYSSFVLFFLTPMS